MPPKKFGKFRQLESDVLLVLLKVLEPFLPRSRRFVETLRLTINGFDSSAFFYVPEDEDNESFSGIALVLFGEYHEPTTAFSYFSKKEDVQKVHFGCYFIYI